MTKEKAMGFGRMESNNMKGSIKMDCKMGLGCGHQVRGRGIREIGLSRRDKDKGCGVMEKENLMKEVGFRVNFMDMVFI